MKDVPRRLAALCLCAGLFATALPAAQAQAYPSRPVRMVLGFGTGSSTDIIARYFADLMSRSLGQPFIVENRVGANGNIGMQTGAKAAADGYTLVWGGLGVNAMNPSLYAAGTLGWDPEKDFDAVILVCRLPYMVAVGPQVPANSLPELIAAAKARPGALNSSVTTTSTRIVNELFARTTGAVLTTVPYKTPSAAIVDVLGGRIEVTMETVAALRPHVGAGRLKALAVTSATPTPLMPGVRTTVEQGVPEFQFAGWLSMHMPRGAPRVAIDTINAEMNRILALPETRARLAELGAEPGSGSPRDMQELDNAERKRWGSIIRAAGLKAE